jgi:hypothetical protein
LAARRAEIEQAFITRIYGLGPSDAVDPEYADGLRGTVAAALDYGFEVVRLGADRDPPVPAPLLTQARLAARHGIGLDTVLRRYLAGYTLLNDFLLEEAAQTGLIGGAALRRMIRSQAALFDRLLAAVSEEHAREAKVVPVSSDQRLAELVKRLLAGEMVDTSEFAYDLDAEHLGVVAAGPGADSALRDLANALDRRLLLVSGGEDTVWAWFGGRRPFDRSALDTLVGQTWPERPLLALGEPAQGLAGWRLTHLQARAALPVVARGHQSVVRYADVALLASMLQDDLLIASLPQLYLAPLEQDRDGGQTAHETLRAYFASDRNISSTAAALGVSRRTVSSRLAAVESRLGCSVRASAAQIEAALALDQLVLLGRRTQSEKSFARFFSH